MSLIQAQSSAALKPKMGKYILGFWAVTKILIDFGFLAGPGSDFGLGLDIELVN